MKSFFSLALAVFVAPAFAEIAFPLDRPELQVGDTWTYVRVEEPSGAKVGGPEAITIRERNADGYALDVQFTNAPLFSHPLESVSLDLGWKGTIDGKLSEAKWFDFPLSQGKTWKSHGLWKNPMGAIGDEDLDFTVAGVETVTVPAGTFEAVKIHGTGWWQMTGMSVQGGVGRPTAKGQTQMMDVWYSPKTKSIIKIEYSKTVPSGIRHESYELTAFKPQ